VMLSDPHIVEPRQLRAPHRVDRPTQRNRIVLTRKPTGKQKNPTPHPDSTPVTTARNDIAVL
jgi:hypothetical protein